MYFYNLIVVTSPARGSPDGQALASNRPETYRALDSEETTTTQFHTPETLANSKKAPPTEYTTVLVTTGEDNLPTMIRMNRASSGNSNSEFNHGYIDPLPVSHDNKTHISNQPPTDPPKMSADPELYVNTSRLSRSPTDDDQQVNLSQPLYANTRSTDSLPSYKSPPVSLYYNTKSGSAADTKSITSPVSKAPIPQPRDRVMLDTPIPKSSGSQLGIHDVAGEYS